MNKHVRIQVNGRSLEVENELSVAELLERLNLSPPQVAVEVNHQLVPRSDHPRRQLIDGDQLEVVTLAGGG